MAAPKIYQATTTAPVNIAVIKYWGKRDTKLNLPTNSSLSVTLSQKDLCALTTASCSHSYLEDRLWLNGEEVSIKKNARLLVCLKELRALREELELYPSFPLIAKHPLHIVSENNFPTAAGLASSAAGFAALVQAIADLYELDESPALLSRIARQGSGSACRSMYGGYVAWNMGIEKDGSDSVAEQIAPAAYWPGMRAAILVVSAAKKGVSSTAGMQATVQTSQLFQHRADKVVPDRMTAMIEAIKARDFDRFAELTMTDSNQFHAVCMDTRPPIFYLNDVSRGIIRLIEELNRVVGKNVAAYTFDAGPNAVIYYVEENERSVMALLKACFEGVPGLPGPQTRTVHAEVGSGGEDLGIENTVEVEDPVLGDDFDVELIKGVLDGVSRIILTGVGEGPEKVTDKSLIDEDGMPAS